MEGDLGARRVDFDGPGDKAIKGERLVQRARHQGLENIAGETLRRRASLEIERVQAVEGSRQTDVQASTLLRVRVRIGKMVEIGWKRRSPVHGDPVTGLRGSFRVRWRRRRFRACGRQAQEREARGQYRKKAAPVREDAGANHLSRHPSTICQPVAV